MVGTRLARHLYFRAPERAGRGVTAGTEVACVRPMLRVLAAAIATVSVACSGAGDGGRGTGGGKADDPESCAQDEIALEPAFGGLTFEQPVAALPHPDGGGRWLVVEQRGVVWSVELGGAGGDAGVAAPAVFADLRDRVASEADEAGLLGLAFHPDFAGRGELFVSYTAASSAAPAGFQSRVSRFAVSADGSGLDLGSEEILVTAEQPFANHNGGHIAFGPDGLLYIALGDGGSAGDPQGNAQDPDTLLGKLLRIDVDAAAGERPYGIPADNPFAAGGGRPEIYALGLRNPWRFSFDDAGRLWLADVGQDAFEEIDLIELGGNYGWNLREGQECFGGDGCPSEGLADPVAVYGRDEGISVTGGFVYRGDALPALAGDYVFGDFGSGRVWALAERADGSFERRLLAESGRNISSFAQGPEGELYLIDYAGGGLFALAAPAPDGECAAPDAGTDPDLGTMNETADFTALYDQVIARRCQPCHTRRSFGELGMRDADRAFESLVEVPAATPDCAGRTRVVPGDPAASVLFQKVSGQGLCGPKMPPSEDLSAAEIEAIRAWIAAGALR